MGEERGLDIEQCIGLVEGKCVLCVEDIDSFRISR